MTREEWQAEKNRLAEAANNAWSNYSHARDDGGNTTSLLMMAKQVTDALDSHVELEPAEPAITLTQSQVVALWQEWPKQNARAAAFQGSKDVFKVAITKDAVALLSLLGAPASWAVVLTEAISNGK